MVTEHDVRKEYRAIINRIHELVKMYGPGVIDHIYEYDREAGDNLSELIEEALERFSRFMMETKITKKTIFGLKPDYARIKDLTKMSDGLMHFREKLLVQKRA